MLEAVARRVRGAMGRGPGPAILLYHRVAESPPDPFGLCVSPRHFDEHLAIVARRRRPMPLPALVAAARAGEAPADAIAITFDDGYRDNLDTALPLLERHGIPATFLIASGQVGARRGFWWDELERAVLRTATGAPRREAFQELYAMLIGLDAARREPMLGELLEAAGMPLTAPDRDRALTADELATLAASPLARIGAHTVSHPSLPQLSRAEQLREMRESRTGLEAIVGAPVTSFAYPYGDHDDTSVATARETGFGIGLTCVARNVEPGADPLRLPRIEIHDCDGEGFERGLRRGHFAREAA